MPGNRVYVNFVSTITMLVCATRVAEVSTKGCSIIKTVEYHCTGESAPTSIPDGVNYVILKEIDLTTVAKGQFSHASWSQAMYVYIDAVLGNTLKTGAFEGLNKLRHLKLRGSDLNNLYTNSFRGLPTLEKLDLSDNFYLGMNDVLRVLNDNVDMTLPSLKWLNLANLQTYYSTPIAFSLNVFEILSRRKIEYLDFTNFNIAPFDFNGIKKMCTHLNHLVLKDTVVTDPARVPFTCESLRVLDVRNLISIDLMEILKFIGPLLDLLGNRLRCTNILQSIYNVETLLMSNVFQKAKVGEIDLNILFDLTLCEFGIRHLDASNNNIRSFNSTIKFNPRTIQSLREINFSDNGMEYISPNVLGAAFNAERLNLSRNNLGNMSLNYHYDFEVLLQPFSILKIIDLSQNGLLSIPKYMFTNNTQLQYIFLSNNLISTVYFTFDHLESLQVMDLRGNRLKVLQDDAIRQFENIWGLRKRRHSTADQLLVSSNSLPKLLMSKNPMTCSCEKESLRSLDWIENSGYVDSDATLYCTFNDGHLQLFQSALTKTQAYCHRLKVIRIALIVGGIIASILLVSLIVALTIRRRNVKRDSIHQFSKMIKTGEKMKNLIFLSFCNEDGDYVLEHIYPKMKDEASKTLDCERNLVCCGDLNFRPGMSVCLEAMRCIEESAVIIFVVSNTFCQKGWCKMEVDTANAQRKPVILLMLEKVDPVVMTPYMKKLFNRYTRAFWIRDQNGGYPHPPWPVLISSAIELGSSFNTENQT